MEQIELTPEELFFIGKKIHGKYLDYLFYAAIRETYGQERSIQWKCADALVNKGILRETLLGEPEVDEDTLALLSVVFNGNFRASISVWSKNEGAMQDYRFYWQGGDCTAVWFAESGGIMAQRVSLSELEAFIISLIPKGYNEREAPKGDLTLECDTLERIFTFKNLNIVRGTAKVHQVAELAGWLCDWDEAENYSLVSPLQFYESALGILKGGD